MTTSVEPSPAPVLSPPTEPEEGSRSRRRRPVHAFFTRNRRPIVVVDRWLSFVLLAWIVLESATGAVLVFAPEIDRWVNHDDYAATAGDRGLDAAIASARAARRGEPVNSVVLPGDGRPVYSVSTVDRAGEFHEVLIDPGSGQVLTKDHHEPAVIALLERLHFNINSTSIFGFAPLTIMAWLSIGWIVILFTGVYVWYWPRVRRWLHALRVRTRRGWFTFNLDLHNAIGLVVLVPLLLVIVTGINFAFPRQVEAAWNTVTFGAYQDPDTSIATSKPAPADPIDAQEAERIVAKLDSTVDVESVVTPRGSPVGVYSVYATVDGSYLGLVGGAHDVQFDVDQYTGAILKISDPLDQNGATRAYAEWAGPVHFGTFGGTITRVLWVGVGIAPIALGITGVATYVIRFRRRRRTAPRPDLTDRHTELESV